MAKRIGSLIIGLVFLFLGGVILLKTLGIATIPIWSGFGTYWPIGLILIGLAIIAHQKWVATLLFILLIVLSVMYMTNEWSCDEKDQHETVLEVPVNPEAQSLEVGLDFGAGDIKMAAGTEDALVKNIVTTSGDDPNMKITDGAEAEVRFSRKDLKKFTKCFKEEWEITLTPQMPLTLDLDYGAAAAELDLTGLKVDELDVDFGAGDADILFASYPTKVKIDCGAANLNLRFPEDVGVVIDIDGGAISKDLDDFSQKGDRYKSDNFDSAEIIIEIDINAGASSINAEFVGGEA